MLCSNDWVDSSCSTDRTDVVEVIKKLSSFQRANHLEIVIYLNILFKILKDMVGLSSNSCGLTCGDTLIASTCDLVYFYSVMSPAGSSQVHVPLAHQTRRMWSRLSNPWIKKL